MRRAGFLAVPLLVLGSLAAAQDIPPAEEQAKALLERSPRHGEWMDVKMPSGGAPIRTWVVYPERKEKAGVVLVIHEIFGLSDWIRAVADQLAKEGFIAVAPDLISGKGPGGGGTDSAASRDDVVKLIRTLTPAETNARLNAVREAAVKFPSANGKSATIGFCWGGSASFAYAAAQPLLNAAVVYYGTAPADEALAAIKAPVLGNYGGDDARVDGHGRPDRGGDEEGGQDVRAAHLRRRGPRVSPPADRQGGREPQGHARRVAPDGRLPERGAEVGGGSSFSACRPPGSPSRRRRPRSRGAGP